MRWLERCEECGRLFDRIVNPDGCYACSDRHDDDRDGDAVADGGARERADIAAVGDSDGTDRTLLADGSGTAGRRTHAGDCPVCDEERLLEYLGIVDEVAVWECPVCRASLGEHRNLDGFHRLTNAAGDGQQCVVENCAVDATPTGDHSQCDVHDLCARGRNGGRGELVTDGGQRVDTGGASISDTVDANLALRRLLADFEAVDWTAVPDVSTSEVATWAQRLDAAAEAVPLQEATAELPGPELRSAGDTPVDVARDPIGDGTPMQLTFRAAEDRLTTTAFLSDSEALGLAAQLIAGVREGGSP